jgi:hypothetical protein
MTTNERLFQAGLLDAFDEAVNAGDRAALLAILDQVEMSGDLAKMTVERVLADPKKYGYPDPYAAGQELLKKFP